MTSFSEFRFDQLWLAIYDLRKRITKLEKESTGEIIYKLCPYCEAFHDRRLACKSYVKHNLAKQDKNYDYFKEELIAAANRKPRDKE